MTITRMAMPKKQAKAYMNLKKYREENQRLRNVLNELWEYFDNRADISDRTDDDGTPYPNEEMWLLSEINYVLGER